jgi:hypothetical protein
VTAALATVSIVLGVVYTSYGILTVIDLAKGWRHFGLSHFGLAWVAMAFTCGPHHLDHGLHLAIAGRDGGALELLAVVVGIPAGVTWFLLRLEAMAGGRGDRIVSGLPKWLQAIPYLAMVYALSLTAGLAVVLARDFRFPPTTPPNVLLVVLYCMIGWYLLRTQLANWTRTRLWSVSGISLTIVFPTCALMHATWAAYLMTGRYQLDNHGFVIDWLSVPAAFYFLWVVRGLHLGVVRDWNQATTGVATETVPA